MKSHYSIDTVGDLRTVLAALPDDTLVNFSIGSSKGERELLALLFYESEIEEFGLEGCEMEFLSIKHVQIEPTAQNSDCKVLEYRVDIALSPGESDYEESDVEEMLPETIERIKKHWTNAE